MADSKVNAYVSALEPHEQEFVNQVRQLVLDVHPEIQEHIKWNSTAFFYTGEMEASDAKEYRRDLLVLNLHRGKFLLVFPTGAKIDDSILKGKNYPDGRKIITMENPDDLKKLEPALQAGIVNWMSQIEK